MLELVERGWAELSKEEQAQFEGWLMRSQGVDLYLLLRHARRRWTRRASSVSQTLAAIRDTASPHTEDDDAPTGR